MADNNIVTDNIKQFVISCIPLAVSSLTDYYKLTVHFSIQLTAVLNALILVLFVMKYNYMFLRVRNLFAKIHTKNKKKEFSVLKFLPNSFQMNLDSGFIYHEVENPFYVSIYRYVKMKNKITQQYTYIIDTNNSGGNAHGRQANMLEILGDIADINVNMYAEKTTTISDIYNGYEFVIRFNHPPAPEKLKSIFTGNYLTDHQLSQASAETVDLVIPSIKIDIKNFTDDTEKFVLIKKYINHICTYVKTSAETKIYSIAKVVEEKRTKKKPVEKEEPDHNEEKNNSKFNINKNILVCSKSKKTLVLSENVSDKLYIGIDNFINGKELYARRGIPYTRGYVLYGPPGTGKTSIIKVLAKEYSIPIFVANLSLCENESDIIEIFHLIRNESKMIPHYIVALEDLDRSKLFEKSNMSFDSFYNIIDGVEEDVGRILFITCNNENIILRDKTLCRPGRIDEIIKIDYVTNPQIEMMLQLFYDDESIKFVGAPHKQFTPADIQELCFENTDDTASCIKKITG